MYRVEIPRAPLSPFTTSEGDQGSSEKFNIRISTHNFAADITLVEITSLSLLWQPCSAFGHSCPFASFVAKAKYLAKTEECIYIYVYIVVEFEPHTASCRVLWCAFAQKRHYNFGAFICHLPSLLSLISSFQTIVRIVPNLNIHTQPRTSKRINCSCSSSSTAERAVPSTKHTIRRTF